MTEAGDPSIEFILRDKVNSFSGVADEVTTAEGESDAAEEAGTVEEMTAAEEAGAAEETKTAEDAGTAEETMAEEAATVEETKAE